MIYINHLTFNATARQYNAPSSIEMKNTIEYACSSCFPEAIEDGNFNFSTYQFLNMLEFY